MNCLSSYSSSINNVIVTSREFNIIKRFQVCNLSGGYFDNHQNAKFMVNEKTTLTFE